MRKRCVQIALILVGVALIVAIVHAVIHSAETVAPVPVRLVVTGPDGQCFSGTYTADGNTNAVSATAPAVITLKAGDVAFEFKREGGHEGAGEFRVDLYANNVQRTSTTSDTRRGVRGSFRNTSGSNSVWAAGF